MTVNVLMALDLVIAAVNGFIIWRCEKLRERVAFHLVGFVAAAGVYAVMLWWSASTEIIPDHVPAHDHTMPADSARYTNKHKPYHREKNHHQR